MFAKVQTKRKFSWSGWWLLILVFLAALSLYFAGRAFAQSFPLKFTVLSVALWPEFDQPETLVIYRAQLDADTPLPVELSFRIPGHIDSMYAVAYEQNESLMNIDPASITISKDGDDSLLTFSSPSLKIQFEYYDSAILTKQDQTRTLNYHFSTLYPIDTVTFEVKQPAQAEGFQLTPEADNTFIGNDGSRYSSVQVTDMTADETYSLSASYQGSGVDVLLPDIANPPLGQSESLTLLSDSIGNDNINYLGYTLIGLGLLLFVGAGGYWWFKQTKTDINPQSSLPRKYKRQPASRKKKQTIRRKADVQPAVTIPVKQAISQSVSFCYRCGVALREDSNFCHNCGAERR